MQNRKKLNRKKIQWKKFGFRNLRPQNSWDGLKAMISRIRLIWYSTGYFFHLWIRMIHDRTYEKVPVYKNYSDKPYSDKLHRTVFVAFIFSFVIFTAVQYVLPEIFNPISPKTAIAIEGPLTKTTKQDFDVYKINLVASGIDPTDDSSLTLSENSTSGIISLIFDSQTPGFEWEYFATWAINSEPLPAGTRIYVQFKGSENPGYFSGGYVGHMQAAQGSTSWGGNLVNGDNPVSDGRYLQAYITLYSDNGLVTPTLNDITINLSKLTSPKSEDTILFKSDAATRLKNSNGQIVSQGNGDAFNDENGIKIKNDNLSCLNCVSGYGRKMLVQYNPTGVPFTDESTNVIEGSSSDNGDGTYSSEVNLTNLSVGSFHFRMRAKDWYTTSDWQSYGNNTDINDADVTIDQTSPSLTLNGWISKTNILLTKVDGNYYGSRDLKARITVIDIGGSNLNSIQLSNDGVNWGSVSVGSGNDSISNTYDDIYTYVPGGEYSISGGTYTGDIPWKLSCTPSNNNPDQCLDDGPRNIKIRAADNAGNGLSNSGLSGVVTGGTISQIGNYKIHTFNNIGSHSLNVVGDGGKAEVLVVAGGGSGGGAISWGSGGSGGGGGVIYNDNINLINKNYSIEVGGGGVGVAGQIGANGSNSSFDEIISHGGGGGGLGGAGLQNIGEPTYGRNGGSGGGAGYNGGYNAPGGSGIEGEGFEGASAIPWPGFGERRYGGFSGGGAGGPGTNLGDWEGFGGPGRIIGISGVDIEYGAGADSRRFSLKNGEDYKGEGGSGGSDSSEKPGNGGSGIVIIRYRLIDIYTTTIILDSTPPERSTIILPEENIWTNSKSMSFYWTPSASVDAKRQELAINNMARVSFANNTTSEIQVDTAFSEEGYNNWEIRTYDNAENIISSESRVIGYDETPPGPPGNFVAPLQEAKRLTVKLRWDSPDDISGVNDFIIQRKLADSADNWISVASGECANLGGLSTNCNDTIPLSGKKYNYRIKAQDGAGNWGAYTDSIDGYSVDFTPPTTPTQVSANACLGTEETCLAVDPNNGGTNQKGYATKITWQPSYDADSGVSKYKIYRSQTNSVIPSDWNVVGVLESSGAPELVWYDNDANNDATFGTDKPSPSARLNDSTQYYYRVTALDSFIYPNESELLPFEYLIQNSSATATPDITPPSVPADLTATAVGFDDSGNRQKINLTWSASVHLKSRSQEAVGGTVTYTIYRSLVLGGTYEELTTTTATEYSVIDLDEATYYYFKVKATDEVGNESAQTSPVSERTASDDEPLVPGEVTVTAKTGNPNTDPEVGDKITITFKGSYAKNCFDGNSCLSKYEVYRSLANPTDDTTWLAGSTKVTELTPTSNHNDRANTYTVTDTNLNDATTYYYRVRAGDNSAVPYVSGLSQINISKTHTGWDTTPDSQKPELPQNLSIKDIHDDGLNFKRNIITWSRITAPTRNGTNDFKEYKIYRSNDGLTWSQILENGANPLYKSNQELALATNYYIDLIPVAEANRLYYYYVTAADNAGTDFKYPNGTVINPPYANESEPNRNGDGSITSVSLNPAVAKPNILTLPSGKKAEIVEAGVSSAVIRWQTDQDTDGVVEFRVKDSDENYAGKIERNTSTSHQLTIKPLLPNTTYEYRVISRNWLGNEAIAEGSLVPNLTTAGFNLTPGSVETTTSTAEVNWSTNLEASSAFVEYQLQPQAGDEPQGGTAGVNPETLATFPRSHQVIIKGLRSSRTYTYRLKSISKDGYTTEYPSNGFATFTTRSYDKEQFTMNPASSNIADRNITSTTAQIVWQTSDPTTSWVDYGTESGVYGTSAGNDNMTKTHVITLDGLTPGTKYFYKVRGQDDQEVEYTSQEYSFTAVLKPKISELSVRDVTPYSVTISWMTNVDTETLINWGKTAEYGEKKGTQGRSQIHELKIEDLEDNTQYHYQIVARDELGNEIVDADKVIRTPIDKEGPKIENVKLEILPMGESDTTVQIMVSWKTNKPATSKVEYDIGLFGNKFAQSTVEDPSLNNTHTVIIKGLQPSSTYHYRIISRDKRGNTTTSQDYTFVTPAKEKSIWQMIVRSLEETFGWVKNLQNLFKRGRGN